LVSISGLLKSLKIPSLGPILDLQARKPPATHQSINQSIQHTTLFLIIQATYLGIFHDKSCDERLEQRGIVQVRQDQMIQTVPNSQTLTERPLTLSLQRRQVVLVSGLESGLAIKNPPKKPHTKKPQKPPKNPTKKLLFLFFFEFFMKIIQTFLFETDFL
jgi:hypothetical protein